MTTPAAARKRTTSEAKKSPSTTATRRRAQSPPAEDQAAGKAATPPKDSENGGARTITIPLDRMAHAAGTAVKAPVDVARRVLPAKGGLPVYLGLGALGAAGVLEWPVAVAFGIGYAALRPGGPLNPVREGASGRTASEEAKEEEAKEGAKSK